MDGPSRESYLAMQARKQAWLDALRTRDDMVALDEWRLAVEAVGGWPEDLVPFIAVGNGDSFCLSRREAD